MSSIRENIFSDLGPWRYFALGIIALLSYYIGDHIIFGQHPRQKGCKRPPGPKGIPVLGNVGQFDAAMPQLQFQKWAEEYRATGQEMFYLKLGADNMFVLNSGRLIKEAMDKRSNIYSSRRSPHVAHTIMSKGKRMVFSPNDNRWRAARKQAHSFLDAKAVGGYGKKWQELESAQMLHDILHQDPYSKKTNFIHSFRRYASSVIVNLSFGHRFPTPVDPMLEGIYTAMENVAKVAQPGTYLVDSFPILQKITPPFLRLWDREGERLHRDVDWKIWNQHLSRMKQEYKAGTAKECFVAELLEAREGMSQAELEANALTDYDLGYQICGFLEAGSDTTASTLTSLVLALIHHPEIASKAHKELDRVVGSSRLPRWEDEVNLPYLRCIVKETLRWRPPVPMCVPHSNTKDDILDGYFIPKGSIVIGNCHAIHLDPERYKEPDVFRPERYMDHTKGAFASSLGSAEERDHYAYGFGRRMCVGIHLGEQSLFITMARLLWAFNVKAVEDKEGKAILPDADIATGYEKGFVTAPHWYPAIFTVRSKQHQDVIERENSAAQETFASEGREVY